MGAYATVEDISGPQVKGWIKPKRKQLLSPFIRLVGFCAAGWGLSSEVHPCRQLPGVVIWWE